MAWQDFVLSMNKPKKEIGGLNNFFMGGHWVGDLGLSGAAQSGRDIAQIFCKRDGKKFKSHLEDLLCHVQYNKKSCQKILH